MDKCEASEAQHTRQSISDRVNKTAKAEVVQKVQKLQIPFITNNGQADERVKFHANTLGGTVFVTKDGEIVYALPGGKNEASGNTEANSRPPLPGLEQGKDAVSVGWVKRSAPNRILAFKETLAGGKISMVNGEEDAVTNVSYFKGKDPSLWKANIPTYKVVNLGEVYGGIELKLRAYGNNVEKLFCVKPGADPDQIKVRLSGVNDGGDADVGWVKRSAPNKPNPSPPLSSSDPQNPKLQINKSGQLVAKTALGPVKFTKPVAYQEVNGKKVEVDCKYVMRDRAPSSVRYSKKTSTKNGHAQRLPDNASRMDSPSPPTIKQKTSS